jgi:hypothetical protein
MCTIGAVDRKTFANFRGGAVEAVAAIVLPRTDSAKRAWGGWFMRFTGRFAVVFISAGLAASQCWHMSPALGEPPPEPAATVANGAPNPHESSMESAAGPFGAAIALLGLVIVIAAVGRLTDGQESGARGPGNHGRTTL